MRKTKHYIIDNEKLAKAMLVHYSQKAGRAYLQNQDIFKRPVLSKGEKLAEKTRLIIEKDKS